jgi:hypothetical protein
VASFHHTVQPVFWALLCLFTLPAAQADSLDDSGRGETVFWSVPPQEAAGQDLRVKLTLQASILDGWHVYSLKQAAEGPTPLFVGLDANPVAIADGPVSESTPTKIFEPAFGAETHIFSKSFTITVPVRLKSRAATGEQKIPVSVRFQTCNGRVCQPPKTVHLSAAVNSQAGK